MSQTLEIQESQHPCFQQHVKKDDQDEDDDEALSLSDLPVTVSSEIKGGEDEADNQSGIESDFDFEFGSLIGSVIGLESEMCAADEIFSGGQMLPFRHSVSSRGGLSGFQAPTRSLSESNSLDRTTGFAPRRSSSSRSSSTRSQQSVTTSISSGSSTSMGLGLLKPKPGNPPIRASIARPVNPKSTMWQVLRLGLIRTPEIELRDLSVQRRSNNKYIPIGKVPRNNSINSSSSTDECNKIDDLIAKRRNKVNKVSKNNQKGILFGSCNCSTGVIEPILMPHPPRLYNKLNHSIYYEDAQKNKQQQQQQQRQCRKRVGSRYGAFEWLRDISQTRVLNT